MRTPVDHVVIRFLYNRAEIVVHYHAEEDKDTKPLYTVPMQKAALVAAFAALMNEVGYDSQNEVSV